MIQRLALCLSCVAWSAALVAAPLPGNVAHGRELYRANCVSCHNASIFSRPGHRVRSLPELQKQVKHCIHAVNRPFSDRDVNDLVKYLNDTYYKFPGTGRS